MKMRTLDDLREFFCNQLEKDAEELKQKGIKTPDDLRWVHMVTDTIKNIDKIIMLEEGGYSDDGYSNNGYSHGGCWEAQGRMNGTYGDNCSYANRKGAHLFSHGGGYGSMNGGYSHGDAKSEMIEKMKYIMNMAGNDRDKDIIRRCIEDM